MPGAMGSFPQRIDCSKNNLGDLHQNGLPSYWTFMRLFFFLQVRTYNVEKTRNMRGLNPEDIDQLITISGMVIRTSQIIPEMREGGCG